VVEIKRKIENLGIGHHSARRVNKKVVKHQSRKARSIGEVSTGSGNPQEGKHHLIGKKCGENPITKTANWLEAAKSEFTRERKV